MTVRDKETLKSYFDNGDVPVQEHFWDLIDSMFSSIFPTGALSPFAGSVAPDGWLLCQGQEVSRATYSSLFAIIGTIYGNGNGTTTFNLPNLKGRIPVGVDTAQAEFNSLGETGGTKAVTLTELQMPSHSHTQNSHNHMQNSHSHTQNAHTHIQNAHTHIQNAHTHIQNPHSHYVYKLLNTGGAIWATEPLVGGGYNNNGTKDTSIFIGGTTSDAATNQNATPTNQSTTPTNQSTTATNQSTTATNQSATATNNNSGGNAEHTNLQPYIALNYIIKI